MLEKGLVGTSQNEAKEIKRFLKKLSEDIQLKRQSMEMTQEQFAESLNVNVNTVKYIEQGRRIPSLPMLLRILKALKMSIEIK